MSFARNSGEEPHALLYLHGYNTSFEEAAIRAAQIGFDLKVPGATAFFSWPYFARAEALLHDIYDLMRHGAAPAQRQRLAPAISSSGTYWKLRR